MVTLIAFVLVGIVVGVGIFTATNSIRNKEAIVAQKEAIILGSMLTLVPLLDSQGAIEMRHSLDPRFSYEIKDNSVTVRASKFSRHYKYAGFEKNPEIAEEGGKIVIKAE